MRYIDPPGTNGILCPLPPILGTGRPLWFPWLVCCGGLPCPLAIEVRGWYKLPVHSRGSHCMWRHRCRLLANCLSLSESRDRWGKSRSLRSRRRAHYLPPITVTPGWRRSIAGQGRLELRERLLLTVAVQSRSLAGRIHTGDLRLKGVLSFEPGSPRRRSQPVRVGIGALGLV
ncbi:hypothetical protein FA13DRAFT_1030393 [Coprinellus micaceus]|uniref:Uncharacterized protein n=1 Tax=Coprinellus micaceus TaxID=71717 RepID=A0A4Y7SZJ4_COPMI|nr:hypothetical protein FA13DRAFT_1030393 [Coprinellus micaceus]